MTFSRLPIRLGGTVAGFKLVAALAVRFGHDGVSAVLLQVVMADIPSWWVAGVVTTVFFDPRRIGPTETETRLFDVALVLVTFVEWFVVGWVIRFARGYRAPR
jgi:hypothetical protein